MLYQINHFLFPNHTIKDDQIASRNKTQALKEETKIILSKKNLRHKYETNKKRWNYDKAEEITSERMKRVCFIS